MGCFLSVCSRCALFCLFLLPHSSGPQGAPQGGSRAAGGKEATGEAEQAPHGLAEHVLPASATDTVRVHVHVFA